MKESIFLCRTDLPKIISYIFILIYSSWFWGHTWQSSDVTPSCALRNNSCQGLKVPYGMISFPEYAREAFLGTRLALVSIHFEGYRNHLSSTEKLPLKHFCMMKLIITYARSEHLQWYAWDFF